MKMRSKKPFFSFLFLFGLILINGIGSTITIPNLTEIAEYYNFSLIGLIEAAFIMTSTLLLIFWGYFTDRTERKHLLWFANILWLIPALIIFLFPQSFLIYIIGRIGMAFGLSAFSPLAYSVLADFAKYQDRGLISSGLNLSWIGSSAAGILIGGLFSSHWYYAFGIISVFGFFLFIWQFYIEIPLRGKQEPALFQIQSYDYHWRIEIRTLPTLIESKPLFWVLFQGIFALIPGTFFTYYLVAFLNSPEGINVSISVASVFAIMIASGRAIGYPFFGKIGDTYSKSGKTVNRARIASICMLGQAIFFFLAFIVISSDLLGLILFGFLFWTASFIGGGSGPNRTSLLYNISLPEYRGSLGAMFSLTDQIGIIIGILLSTIITQYIGYRLAFLGSLVFYLFAALVWSFSIPYINKEEEKLLKIMNKRAKELVN